jgi:uncharacterized phage infection (PIP) family protein YhgE
MQNRLFIVLVIIILVSCLVTGCGIGKSEYDAIKTELDAVKQDRQAAKDMLQAAQSEISRVKSDLQAVQLELSKVQGQGTIQGQLEQAKTDLQTAKEQLQAARADLQEARTSYQTTLSELAGANANLQTAQTQVKSLQTDKDTASAKLVKALEYTEFLDMLMFEFWGANDLPFWYEYVSMDKLRADLNDRAEALGDTNLMPLYDQALQGNMTQRKMAMYYLWYYIFGKIEAELK